MTIDRDRVLSLNIAPQTRDVRDTDVMLYALAVGMAPQGGELDFVYEKTLKAVPSMATVLAYDDSWLEPGGVPLDRVFHASQKLVFHRPLPVDGAVVARNSIAGLIDKGEGKAGLILQQADLAPSSGGKPYATGISTLFVRGGGGFGGSTVETPPPVRVPERAPDRTVAIPTRPEQAALFRLLGDRNPLHIDPEAAEAAGLDTPILHGACTFGIACAALLRHACNLDPVRLKELEARFVGPVFPGEELSMSLWVDGTDVFFRLAAPARQTVVLDAGHATISRG